MLRRHAVLSVFALAALAACDRLPGAGARDDGGGAYVILEIDAAALLHEQLDPVVDLMVAELRQAAPPIRYSGRGISGAAARIRVADAQELARARAALAEMPNAAALIFSDDGVELIEARFTPEHVATLTEQTAARAVEVIRRRVDPDGRAGAEVRIQDGGRIFVRVPGVTDPEQIRRVLGIRGQLTFHVVRELSAEDVATGILPPGTMLAQPYPEIGYSAEVVERDALMTGERLRRASPTRDPVMEQFVLSFELDDEGRQEFCRITTRYTNQRFAILLDNQVVTAPRINEPICGGSGQITGNLTPESASELAILLNAGALPAPVSIVEEGVLPPGA